MRQGRTKQDKRERLCKHAEAFTHALATKRPLLVLVTGARDWADAEPIRRELLLLPHDSILLHGNARGADRLAGAIAAELGLDVRPRPANWERFGKAAGIIRNREMLAEGPDVILAFHPNLEQAKGTNPNYGRALLNTSLMDPKNPKSQENAYQAFFDMMGSGVSPLLQNQSLQARTRNRIIEQWKNQGTAGGESLMEYLVKMLAPSR